MSPPPAVQVTQQTTTECPECAARIPHGALLPGEVLTCPECEADLEVRQVQPTVVLALAPPVEEDWGE